MCIYTNILKLFTCACVNGKTSLFCFSLSQSHEAVVKLGACTGQQKGNCQNRKDGVAHSTPEFVCYVAIATCCLPRGNLYVQTPGSIEGSTLVELLVFWEW